MSCPWITTGGTKCDTDAAIERAHWWNQGAKAERRRLSVGTCTSEISGVDADVLSCSLLAGHRGRHRSDDGAEWHDGRGDGDGLLEQMLDALRGMEQSHSVLLDLVKRLSARVEALEDAASSGSVPDPSRPSPYSPGDSNER